VVLIAEDDLPFGSVILDIARQHNLKGILAPDGETGLEMARRYGPSAIVLDIQMPGVDGWEMLDELKRNPKTRHIPVLIVSGADPRMGMAMGAIAYIEKPASPEALHAAFSKLNAFLDRPKKELLLIEDDSTVHEAVGAIIAEDDVNVTTAETATDGIKKLSESEYDCVVLDLMLPDMNGSELLKQVKKQERFKHLPIIVYTAKDLNKREESQLKKYAASIIVKGPRSDDRLLDETSLFLHRSLDNLTPRHRRIIESHYAKPIMAKGAQAQGQSMGQTNGRNGHGADLAALNAATAEVSLVGRKVLVVDDDVRNIFALTSTLEKQGMVVLFDERGKNAIKTLRSTSDIDVVLMDVMMPEMDGYETMQAIRRMKDREDLPIIAITAKAMAGDREKCLEAGASEYLSKPVDTSQLFAMIRRLIAGRGVASVG
jgi:CheY-like chemotaxis protein